jgi:hypothetical protein
LSEFGLFRLGHRGGLVRFSTSVMLKSLQIDVGGGVFMVRCGERARQSGI